MSGANAELGTGWLSRLRSRNFGQAAVLDPRLDLFAQLPDAAFLIDDSGQILEANSVLLKALGPTLPLRPGLPSERIFAPASREAFLLWLSAGIDDVELNLAAPEGQQGALVCPVRMALSGPGTLILLRDAGQRQLAAAQLAEADRLQALGTLAGGIAHDFNNLLSVIVGAADQAAAQIQDGDRLGAAQDLEQIREAAGRGAGLVRQLLAYARQQVLEPRLVSLNPAVADMARLLRPLLGQQITLELGLDEPGRMIRIDPSQLDRVLMNLAMNARQAMPQGGVLSLSTGRALLLEPLPGEPEPVPPGRWTVLEVRDTGHGIPPELLPRIFEPFFTSRAQQGGTGMGLATVHGIVRQSGGYLLVDSSRGKGSRFRIFLPRLEEAALDMREPHQVAPDTSEKILERPQPGPLLLVEDQAPLRQLAERALRRAGLVVITAEDAEDALSLLDKPGLKPSLLVSDVVLPGMDGTELAALLRERFPRLPVLLVSGYAPTMVGEAPDAEGFRYLSKPYRPAELVTAVTELLNA